MEESEGMEKIKVLVIEDIALIAKINKITLAKLGCEVTIAMTGEDAVIQFKKQQFDIIFMDLGLPDMDGLSITETIRQLEKVNHTCYTPIVALTAHTSDIFQQNSVASGMDNCLSKPLTEEKAREAIDHYVFAKKGSRYIKRKLFV